MSSNITNALTIAGSDSGGGAGIQADLKTFSALGVYGASVICALTAQNTCDVRDVYPVPPAFITAQLQAVFDDIRIDAIKIGMLGDAATVRCVADQLRQIKPQWLVLDPVMIAKSGDRLLANEAVEVLRTELIPLASLITPNLPEAAVLTGLPEPDSIESMYAMMDALIALGAGAVLLKGGHLDNSQICHDLLAVAGEVHHFQAPRIATVNTHGTGCSMASAITALLARGKTLPEAVAEAKNWLSGAIAASSQLSVGQGQGPVQHFYQFWR